MSRFEREIPNPLLYKEGDMVMGYHHGNGGQFFVAGKIVKAEQEKSIFSENSYDVELIEEFEAVKGATMTLKENEIVPFDKDRVLKAMEHFTKEGELRGRANQEHDLAMNEIYWKRTE